MGLFDGLLGKSGLSLGGVLGTLIASASFPKRTKDELKAMTPGTEADIDIPDAADPKFKFGGGRYSVDRIIVKRLK